MSTMTLRGLDETISGALREKARREDTSVNAVVLSILKTSLGLEKKKRSAIHTDLDHLAGTWSKEDAAEFAGVVAEFGRVDEEMWK